MLDRINKGFVYLYRSKPKRTTDINQEVNNSVDIENSEIKDTASQEAIKTTASSLVEKVG